MISFFRGCAAVAEVCETNSGTFLRGLRPAVRDALCETPQNRPHIQSAQGAGLLETCAAKSSVALTFNAGWVRPDWWNRSHFQWSVSAFRMGVMAA